MAPNDSDTEPADTTDSGLSGPVAGSQVDRITSVARRWGRWMIAPHMLVSALTVVTAIIGFHNEIAEFAENPSSASNFLGLAGTSSACGNGKVESGEDCDDGNIFTGDSCDPSCQSNVARIGGGLLVKGYTQAEFDEGLHRIVAYKDDEFMNQFAKHAMPPAKIEFGGFWIMKTEVSREAIAHFMSDSTGGFVDIEMKRSLDGHPSKRSEQSSQWHRSLIKKVRRRYSKEHDPRLNVKSRRQYPAQEKLETAIAYCAWLGGSLPTEEQWEAAARGSDGKRIFPWGARRPESSPRDCDLIAGFFELSQNEVFNCSNRDGVPVGTLKAGCTPDGVCELAGNADEWVLPGSVRWKPMTIDGAEVLIAQPVSFALGERGQSALFRECNGIAAEDPYGLVTGRVRDCVRFAGDSRKGINELDYDSMLTRAVLKGGNYAGGVPTYYQPRSRYPFQTWHGDECVDLPGYCNKGFRCTLFWNEQ